MCKHERRNTIFTLASFSFKNTHDPQVEGAYSCSIVELGPRNQLCATIRATDADVSALFSRVTFTLLGGRGFFRLNGSDVITSAPLDRQQVDGTSLVVVATDGGGRATFGSVTITVTDKNDNTPRFSRQVYTTSVREDATGENVTVVEVRVGMSTRTVHTRFVCVSV
jgi:hypothetical protein